MFLKHIETQSKPNPKDWVFCFLCSLTYEKNGQVAQLVERRPEEPSVGGSNPSLSTNI
jgi:hypothetical protein